MINILLLTVSIENIGPSKALYEIAAGLDKSEFNVSICFCSKPPYNQLKQKIMDAGINIFDLDMHGLYSVKGLFRLCRIVKKNNIDIIHSRLIRANFYGGIASHFMRVCHIVNIVDDYNRHFTDFHESLAGKIFKRITDTVINKADRIVTNSKNIAMGLLKENAAWSHKISTIYNGVEIPQLDLHSHHRNAVSSNQTIKVGSVGRLAKKKDFISFIEAAALVLKKRNNVIFSIAGDGDQKEILNERIKSLGIEKNFTLVGHSENTFSYLSDLDIFVFTSHFEGMPNSILEAMVSSLPILTFDFSGADEIISNGAEGFLIVNRDINELADRISMLIDDKNLSMKLGNQGREKAQKHNSLKIMVDKFRNEYFSLISTK